MSLDCADAAVFHPRVHAGTAVTSNNRRGEEKEEEYVGSGASFAERLGERQ